MKRYIAYWYEQDAIDAESGDFIPDAVSSDCFDDYTSAMNAGKRGAFKSGVAEWCQVVEQVLVNAKYDHWNDVQTTTFSRNNNRWSVEEIHQAP